MLDSIAELKDHCDKDLDDLQGHIASGNDGDDEQHDLACGSSITGPMLLYGMLKGATQWRNPHLGTAPAGRRPANLEIL